jgi:hypothetical protein
MIKSLTKVPKAALHFTESIDNTSPVVLSAADENGKRTLTMKAHSGKPMKHWYYDKLVVDTTGVKFKGKRFPVLNEHWVRDKIGSSGKLVLQDDYSLHINEDDFKYLNNDVANEFISNSDDGFPYQASISIRPTKIERLSEGAKAEVNGFTLRGPATIFRESLYRETSVCVWGADSDTESKAGNLSDSGNMEEFDCEIIDIQLTEEFSGADNNINENNEEDDVIKKLTFEELQEKDPELFEKILTLGGEKFAAAQKAAKNSDTPEGDDSAISKLTEMITKLTTKITVMETESFKMSETLKSKDHKDEAEGIYLQKFSDMNLGKSYSDRVRRLVSFKSFKKDGVFDVEAFTAALDKELKTWEEFADTADTSVIGGVNNGSNKTNPANFAEKKIDGAVDELLDSINFKSEEA